VPDEHLTPNWDSAFAEPNPPPDSPPPATSTPAAPDPPQMFSSLEAWISTYLAPIITVELGPGMRWCPQWWRHPEAVSRLEALWRAWEHMRIAADPTSMSLWWREHADHHLEILLEGTRTPFKQCSAEPGHGHRDDLRPLPVQPAPQGWFGSPSAPPPGPI